jgi:hypothetical protein
MAASIPTVRSGGCRCRSCQYRAALEELVEALDGDDGEIHSSGRVNIAQDAARDLLGRKKPKAQRTGGFFPS